MRILLRHPSVLLSVSLAPHFHPSLDLLFTAAQAETVSEREREREWMRGCDRAPPNTCFTSHFPFCMLTNPFWIRCVCVLAHFILKLLVGLNLINPLFANERLPHQQHRTVIQETEDPVGEIERETKERRQERTHERARWRVKFKSTSASVTKWFIRQTNIQHAYKLISLICLQLPLPLQDRDRDR